MRIASASIIALAALLAACESTEPTEPVDPAAGQLELVSGNGQQGLVNRPLADSLTVRVRTAAGQAVAGATVSWSTTGGVLSSTSTVTDADGRARVQWTPSSGSVSAMATLPDRPPVVFSALANPPGACTIAPNATTQRFSLGATDYTLSLNAANPVRAAVVFVDYPGLVGTENPNTLMTNVITAGIAQLEELSYGRIDLQATAFPTWYRMPNSIESYTWTTYAGHRQFLLDVLAATDAAIDYSSFNALYVFSPSNTNKITSPTFNGGTTANVIADGRNFGNAVTFGNDSRTFGASVMSHETGHMLGLVDLYAFTPAGGTNYSGNGFKYVGAWTLMSNIFVPGHYLTWEKRKLGWIDESQVDCLPASSGVETVLTPNHVTGGRKMVIVPIDASSALVVEARSRGGLDANLCADGVLLYVVDARIPTGQGPAQVVGSRASTSGTAFNTCGPWADGTFKTGAGEVASYTHAPSATTITVLGSVAGGGYRVRVKR